MSRLSFRLLMLLIIAVVSFSDPVFAAIVASGDTDPAAGSSWWSGGGDPDIDIYVGKTVEGLLDIDDGSSFACDFSILGYDSGSTGTATVDGDGSTWNITNGLLLGERGSGVLNIINGGSVCSVGGNSTYRNNVWLANIRGSTGCMSVQGSGSALTVDRSIVVGCAGSGVFNVTDGGTVSSEYGSLACDPGSTASVTIDGINSSWTINSSLNIGVEGTGTLSIKNGAKVSSNTGFIGGSDGHVDVYAYGSTLVDGTGSEWMMDSDLSVGCIGRGVLNVVNGGLVSCDNASIGKQSGSNGSVTVSGNESLLDVNATLYVGLNGIGTLNVIDEANAKAFTLLVGASNTGKVNITGGSSVDISDRASIGSSGEIHFDDGVLATRKLEAQRAQLTGTGTIHTKEVTGSAGDADLVFDAASPSSCTYVLNDSAAQNITIHLAPSAQESLNIGHTGNGSLTIRDGVRIDIDSSSLGIRSGASGVVNIDGIGSIWNLRNPLDIGLKGSGLLSARNGASINSSAGVIGAGTSALGVATVDGENTSWKMDSVLLIGFYGTGTLSITGGGSVYSDIGDIGNQSGSHGTATIDGADSSWSMNSDLFIGNRGSGTLHVKEGGTVSSNSGLLGYNTSSQGIATIDGTESTWVIHSNLAVGSSGSGTLNITDGGTVTVADTTSVASSSSNSSKIHFENGTLTTRILSADISKLTGTGTIYTHSLPCGAGDAEITFDSVSEPSCTFTYNRYPEQNLTIHFQNPSADADLHIGYTDSGSLAIRNENAISSNNGYLGFFSGSQGTATVEGIGSSWNIGSDLVVGLLGRGELHILNGGSVSCKNGYIGNNSSSNNTANIEGPGSNLTVSGTLYVGRDGTGELSIMEGATVHCAEGVLGYSSTSSASVEIIGTDSQWDVSSYLYVGKSGAGAINIAEGGTVFTNGCCLGEKSGSTGTATIDGNESKWIIGGSSLTVGSSGRGTLNIINGAAVDVKGSTYITSYSGSTGEIHFDNGTLTTQVLRADISQLTGTGTIFAGSLPGGAGDVDLLFDAEHGSTNILNLSVLPEQNITLHLTPDRNGNLDIGHSGNGSITICDGITISSFQSILGYNAGSTGVATVSGAGSIWKNNVLYVGNYGNGELSILDGGYVSNVTCTIGVASGSFGTATVDGEESAWDIRNNLLISNGILNITNGGYVSSRTGGIGLYSGLTGTVSVDGEGSTWNVSTDLTVGNKGPGTLNIKNGGTVRVAGTTYLGIPSSNAGNIHLDNGTLITGKISGNLSRLTGVGNAYIGSMMEYGRSGDITFDAETPYFEVNLYNPPSRDITLFLRPSGDEDLYVGSEGAGSLTIRDGITISNKNGYLIGYNQISICAAMIDGQDSVWNNNANLYVGYHGDGTLDVTNGGKITCVDGFLSFYPNSTGSAAVDGSGSMWNLSGKLYVGYYGIGSLDITNGGVVTCNEGLIGDYSYSSNNSEVIVDGAGSTWNISDTLRAGRYASAGITVSNGGTVNCRYASIGNANSILTVSVDGAGSKWNTSTYIYIGYSNRLCQFCVADGGNVSSNSVRLSSGSTITLEDIGSNWTSSNLDIYSTCEISEGSQLCVSDQLFISSDIDSVIKMSTGGKLALAGEADGSLQEFLDLVTGSDAIRFWDNIHDDWSDITEGTYGLDYTLQYIDDGGSDLFGYTLLTVLTAPKPMGGDADRDNDVDADDAARLAENWLTMSGAKWADGDFNNDGRVDEIDASILAANWQRTGDANPAVPEPNALALLLTAAAATIFCIRRQASCR